MSGCCKAALISVFLLSRQAGAVSPFGMLGMVSFLGFFLGQAFQAPYRDSSALCATGAENVAICEQDHLSRGAVRVGRCEEVRMSAKFIVNGIWKRVLNRNWRQLVSRGPLSPGAAM